MKKRVDIIGAGIGGLASAYFLARSPDPPEIHVWERAPEPGGLAGSFTTDRFSVEKFYHHLYRRDTALQGLIADMGLEGDLLWRPASTGSYFNARPYRLSTPLDLLRYRPLPFVDRLRLGLLMLHARRHRDWRQLDDISVRDYVTRISGENVYRTVWEPLFRGKFGPYADSVSAAWLWSKLVDRGGSRRGDGREVLGYLRGGLGRLFRALVDYLTSRGHTMHFGEEICRLEPDAQGRIAALRTRGGRHVTDTVISGAQVPDLADILPEQLDEYRKALRRIRFLGNVCLVLTLHRSLSDFYWTNVSDPSFPFVGVIEQTRWADRSDFQNKHVAYISAYVPRDDPRTTFDADQLVDFYMPHMKRMFPGFSGDDIESRFMWTAPYAQPVVEVGYRHLIPTIETPAPNLYACTMAQIYPHDRQVSNGVEMAEKTADLVLERLRQEPTPSSRS